MTFKKKEKHDEEEKVVGEHEQSIVKFEEIEALKLRLEKAEAEIVALKGVVEHLRYVVRTIP